LTNACAWRLASITTTGAQNGQADVRSDLEEILRALYESEINASISWVWDGGINVELGDPLNGYAANDKVSTFAKATAWFRDQACKHYPDSEFARKYGGFV
jgi:hypothetical protein